MKQFFLLLAFCAGVLSGAEVIIGAPAPELADCTFIKGDPVKIAGKNSTPTLLFFWSIGYASNQELGKMIGEAKNYGDKLRVVTIGCDDEAKLRQFFGTKEIPFAVVADNKLANVNAFLAENEQVPFCVILDKNGNIAWRGAAAKAAAPLQEIVSGKYDFAKAVRVDKYKRDLADAMAKKDFKHALELTDAELQQNPENLELLIFAVNLLDKGLGTPDAAQARLADAVQKFPKNIQLHEVYLRYLHLRHQRETILAEIDFAITQFADDPAALNQLVSVEMSFPVGELSPTALLHLGQAIRDVKTYKNDRERAVALLLYAKVLSFCNAPEAALQYAMQAKPLLKEPREITEIDAVIAHYQEILDLSRKLQK